MDRVHAVPWLSIIVAGRLTTCRCDGRKVALKGALRDSFPAGRPASRATADLCGG